MNLLLINYEYPPIGAGAANATYYMAKSFAEEGHQVVVLTAGYNEKIGYEVENGVHVYRVPSRREKISSSSVTEMLSYVWNANKQLKEVIKKHEVQKAIIFFSIPCGFLGPVLLKKYKIPYLISLRGGDVPGMEKGISKIHTLITPFRRRILKQAHAIIANSFGLAKASESADPFPVEVIPNGVDTNLFKPIERTANKLFSFLFVGRFQAQKNLQVLLEVFANAFKNKPVQLTLVGDGPQKDLLLIQAQTLGVEKQLNWLPWQTKDNLKKCYQTADCLINYSLYEGMPNVVLEAMACGLPIIASNIMGHEELIANGETGFLVDLNNNIAFEKALITLLNDEDLRTKMGKNCRIKVEENYSWHKVAETYLKFF
jgi:glycosyltransferase involved in cell wall biosynthesis